MMDQDFLNNVMTDSDVTTKSRRSRMSETKNTDLSSYLFVIVALLSTEKLSCFLELPTDRLEGAFESWRGCGVDWVNTMFLSLVEILFLMKSNIMVLKSD